MIHVSFELNEISQGEAQHIVRLLDHRFPGLLAGRATQTIAGDPAPVSVAIADHPSAPSADAETAATSTEASKPKNPRGRPRKEPTEATPEVPTPAPSGSADAAAPSPEPLSQAAPAGEAKPLTVDELRAGLQKFTVKHGLVKGKELLDSFSCARVTELADLGAKVHAKFMEKCDA